MLSAFVAAHILASSVVEKRCMDTWIDKEHPTANYGADSFLFVGPGASALVRFPLVDLAVGQGSKVSGAKIVLHTAGAASQTAHWTATPVTQPWIEGGGRGLTATDAPSKAWATYSGPMSGRIWEITSPNPLTVSVSGETVTISGIDALVQQWIDTPSTNFGIKLESNESATLPSSESLGGEGPELDVDFAPATPAENVSLAEPQASSWHVVVLNPTQADAPAAQLTWVSAGGQAGTADVAALHPGASTELSIAAPTDDSMTFKVGGSSLAVDPKTKPLAITATAQEAAAWQGVIREANEWDFPRSRSKSFPNGATARFRLAQGDAKANPASIRSLVALGCQLPPTDMVDPTVSAGWVTDTRDDSLSDSKYPLPEFGWQTKPEVAQLIPQLGYLSPGEVALLDTGKDPKNPEPVLLRLENGGGQPLGKCHLSLTLGDKTTEIDSPGVMILSAKQMPTRQNPVVKLTVTKGGLTESTNLTVWDTWRESLRGTGLATIEKRFMLPGEELDNANDLAVNRIVSDQANRRPAQLNAVVDGSADTALALDSDAGQGWVEIDMGQDHRIGKVEIEFLGDVPEQFDLSLDKTGGAEGGAQLWYQERYGSYQARMRGVTNGVGGTPNHTKLSYCGAPTIGRFLRLSLGAHQKASIAGIKVFRVKDD